MRHLAAVLTVLAVCAGPACAQEKPEPLPAPTPVGPPAVIVEAPVVYYRVNRYEVWQYYSVNSYGRWRPRVIEFPDGSAYYLQTGQPYPTPTLRSSNRARLASD
jgi:hypothetical protein